MPILTEVPGVHSTGCVPQSLHPLASLASSLNPTTVPCTALNSQGQAQPLTSLTSWLGFIQHVVGHSCAVSSNNSANHSHPASRAILYLVHSESLRHIIHCIVRSQHFLDLLNPELCPSHTAHPFIYQAQSITFPYHPRQASIRHVATSIQPLLDDNLKLGRLFSSCLLTFIQSNTPSFALCTSNTSHLSHPNFIIFRRVHTALSFSLCDSLKLRTILGTSHIVCHLEPTFIAFLYPFRFY